MLYRRLGKSGLKVSALSFGSWVTFGTQVDDRLAIELMTMSYDAGVNFYDNAEVYGQGQSEVIMGRALKKLGWGRDTYAVSSKVFWGGDKPTQMGLSAKHVRDACDAALTRLQVDYLDLYFCHRPDLHTPIEETVRAMHQLVTAGKILYWGTSEWSAQQITEAHLAARQWNLTPPTMEQPQYNMFHREKVEAEYAPLYGTFGLGTTIWSPLASGVLSGKYSKGIPEGSRLSLPGYEWLRARWEAPEGRAQIERAVALEGLARELGCSLAQLAIAWCLRTEKVSTVILGASKVEQLRETLQSLPVLERLTPKVVAEIELILANSPKSPQDFAA